MAFPDFLNKKKKDNSKKGKTFDAQILVDKCRVILDQIKSINEERYSKLYRTFMNQFDKTTNIQKKKITGFYAQLIDELKNLQGNAQERLYATGQHILKKAKKTAKNNPAAKKVVKKVSKAIDKVAKKTTKKKTEKKVAKKVVKKTEKKAKKKVTKKTKKK